MFTFSRGRRYRNVWIVRGTPANTEVVRVSPTQDRRLQTGVSAPAKTEEYNHHVIKYNW